MRKYISFLIISGLCVQMSYPVLTEAALMIPKGFAFQKDLKMGQTVDPDVKHLQNLLNSNPATKVADTGSGSDVALTPYFGSKTRDAVIRFQSLYASEVLAPAGLTAPTGFVGSLTRAKLNSLFYALSESKNQLPPTTTGTTQTQASFITGSSSTSTAVLVNSTVIIADFSTYKVAPGQSMAIFGRGFDAQANTVQIGETVIEKVPSTDNGTKLIFTVPTNAKPGVFSVLVYSPKGVANSGPIGLQIGSFGTAGLGSKPAISGVNPKTTSNPLQIITITGSGFSNANNVVTNLGTIRNVRSVSGSAITFYLTTLPFYYQAEQKYKGQAINLVISINNEYGTSTEQAVVTLNMPKNPGSISTADNAQSALESAAFLQNYLASSTEAALAASSTATSTDNIITEEFLQQLEEQAIQQAGGSQALVTTTAVGGSTYSETGGSQQSSSEDGGGNTAALVAAGVIGVAVAAAIAKAAAQNKATPPYFGGRIHAVIPCTANGMILFVVEDFAHMHAMIPLMFDPKMSRLNAYFKISPGNWTIGGYLPIPKPCFVGAFPTAVLVGTSIGTVDIIRGVGTSLIPGIPGII